MQKQRCGATGFADHAMWGQTGMEGDLKMAYDPELDARVAQAVSAWGAIRKAMFGGTGYMLRGNLFAGVYKDRLLVRLSAQEGAAALDEPHVTPFDMMPRPMPGWITVDQDGLDGPDLVRWLERGRAHALSLPAK